jgi:hypothetical protein
MYYTTKIEFLRLHLFKDSLNVTVGVETNMTNFVSTFQKQVHTNQALERTPAGLT